jgi:hypothetical protein
MSANDPKRICVLVFAIWFLVIKILDDLKFVITQDLHAQKRVCPSADEYSELKSSKVPRSFGASRPATVSFETFPILELVFP